MRPPRGIELVVRHAVLISIGLLFLFPFYWLVTTALKPDTQIFQMPPAWVPHPLVWQNYPGALTDIPFFLYTLNTLKICACNVGGTVLASSLVAYSLAKIRWPGRNFIFYSLIATMILPAQVTMIPTFLIFKELGWIGTMLPLTVPPFLGGAFSIFLLRQFFMTIPNDLSDAARIDGCGELGIYWRVVMPLAKTGLVTVGLFAFIGSWNDFMGPLLYLDDENTYTLAIGLQKFVSQHGAEWGKLMAASSLMALPIVILFFLAQRVFVKGVVLTGSKE
jgi:multiple sugar transport system permease protein